jgi:hypothetical protein
VAQLLEVRPRRPSLILHEGEVPSLGCSAKMIRRQPSVVRRRGVPAAECHTRFSVENRMHLICVPGSQFHTYDRLMSVISQDNAQKRTEKVY